MIDVELYNTIPNELSEIINTTQSWILMEIAKQLRRSGEFIPTTEWMLERLNAIQTFDVDYRKELSNMSKLSLKEIDRIFEKAAISAYTFDKKLFDAKGIPFVPYEKNAFLQQITQAMSKQSQGTFKNLTKTVGYTAKDGKFLKPRDYFTRKLSEAEFQVVSGVMSYDQVIKHTVRELVDSGLRTVEYPHARPRRIETVVRANILTGISNLSGEIAWKNIETLGLTVIETTAHHNARPDHVLWQGKRFALNGAVAEVRARAGSL